MIDDGIKRVIYEVRIDYTLQDFKRLQNFLYRNFKENEHYKRMYPHNNQSAKLYGTAKTHKFSNINEVKKEELKFHPIID